MTLLAQNWYSLNSSRRFPLDDAATAISDAGEPLPADFLVDAYLRFPESVGRYIFVSSVHISSTMLSLTLLASDTPAQDSSCNSESSSATPGASFTPLAAITIARSTFTPFRQYALEPMYPGVGGWVVLGDVRSVLSFSGLFSTIQQSMLLPRLCRSYVPLPVPEISKLFNETALSGLVTIRAGVDISVTKATRLIEGFERDALVIALIDAPERNVLDLYRGPCSGRPESNTCLQPGVETINGVTPDCRGNIDIVVISDCADVVKTNANGILIDYCLGLADACTDSTRLPQDGQLPNDHADYCAEERGLDDGELVHALGLEWGLRSYSSSSSLVALPCVDLPYVDNFQDGGADYFLVESGQFQAVDGAYKATLRGHHNLAVWDGCLQQSILQFPVIAEFVIPTAGGRPNAGLVIDHKDNTYYVVELDKVSDSFRLRYYTGQNFITLVQRPRIAVKFDTPYAIHVTFEEHDTFVKIICKLRAEHAHGVTLATFDANIARLKTPGGRVGLQAYTSEASFLRFAVGEVSGYESSSTTLSSEALAEFSLSSGQPCEIPLENLRAFWRLEESATQTRVDSVGGLDMTPSAAMSRTAGPHESYGVTVTDNAYLATAEDDSLSLGLHAFSVFGWVRFTAVPTVPTVLWGKNTGPSLEWLVYADADGFHAAVSPNGVTHVSVAPDNARMGVPVVGDWYQVALWYNRDEHRVHMEVNNDFGGYQNYNDTVYASTAPVQIGRTGTVWLPGTLSADVDDLAFFDAALSQEARACLYLNGIQNSELQGLLSTSVSPVAVSDPIAFWKLNEAGDFDDRLDVFDRYTLLTIGDRGATTKTGVLDGAVSFAKYRQGLKRDDSMGVNGLSPGNADFSFGGWIYGPYTTLTTQCLGGVWGTSPSEREYALFMTPTGYTGCVSADGTVETSAAFDEMPGRRSQFWRHVLMTYEQATGQVRIYVNGQLGNTSSPVATIYQGAAPFGLGCSSWKQSGNQKYGDAAPLTFDDWGFWDVKLTDEEAAAVYNNGLGWQPDA